MFSNDGTKPRPLAGIRIVECGVWHAGPGADAILADLGAEVIKVESLEGDPVRTNGRALGAVAFDGLERPDWSLLYEISNRNKKSICLDLGSREGQEILGKLVTDADVFLTNLKKTSIPKLNLDYESIKARNPRIIHASISGFGAEGPMSEFGGFDPLGQAVSGMAFLAGQDEPVVLQTYILDQLTAIAASHAVQTALLVRERQGHGQAVHVSLYGTAIWLLYCNIMATSVMGNNPMVSWDRKANPPLRNSYKCRDGEWLLGTNHPEHRYWGRFCDVIGRPDLREDPRFDTVESRKTNTPELIATLDAIFLERDRDDWASLLRSNDLLFSPVHRVSDVVRDPQALANGYMLDVHHPFLGDARIPGYPVQFSANDTCTGPAPAMGEHTDVLLAGLGYSADQIAEMRAAGVLK